MLSLINQILHEKKISGSYAYQILNEKYNINPVIIETIKDYLQDYEKIGKRRKKLNSNVIYNKRISNNL